MNNKGLTILGSTLRSVGMNPGFGALKAKHQLDG